jgi:hypothetical protein
MRKTSHEKEEPMLPPRLLLLGGLALAVLVAALFVAVLATGETPQAIPATGPASGSETDPDHDTEDAAKPSDGLALAGTVAGQIGSSDDPLTAGVGVACEMFGEGATVKDFAAWFEAEIGDVGQAEEELFQAIIVEALTEACPEVVSTGS